VPITRCMQSCATIGGIADATSFRALWRDLLRCLRHRGCLAILTQSPTPVGGGGQGGIFVTRRHGGPYGRRTRWRAWRFRQPGFDFCLWAFCRDFLLPLSVRWGPIIGQNVGGGAISGSGQHGNYARGVQPLPRLVIVPISAALFAFRATAGGDALHAEALR